MSLLKSLVLFLAAGACEVGGGWLVWLWLRDGRSALLGALGGLVLFLYGILPTFQEAPFGRVYAAYGGVFIVMSLLWGWAMEGAVPDRFDYAGATLCLLGVLVMMYAPRG